METKEKERMSRYCKAYPNASVKKFEGWTSVLPDPAPDVAAEDTAETAEKEVPFALDGSKYVFVHDDYSVTKGIYLNEDVLFHDITPEWIEFCRNELKFEVPARQELGTAPSGDEVAVAGAAGVAAES
jgi:hypothetical protein